MSVNYAWEYGHKFYVSDKYDKLRVVFDTDEQRRTWLDSLHSAEVIYGYPDIFDALNEGLYPKTDAEKQAFISRWNIPTNPGEAIKERR